ncbi:MAG: thiamine phosphate synthase [Lachnospiraceae bacterium]|nr:thiamine phosphate synthase [Lachnospiraceae bacterium]
MKFDRDCLRLYAVTDRSWLRGETLYTQVEKALRGGATMVQLREKELDEAGFEKEAVEILQLCHRFGVPFIVNDNVELAQRVGADGVHIGQDDMQMQQARKILGPDKVIGVTAKTVEQAVRAQEQGADYLGSGAVFGSTTKQDAKPMEHALLQEICESVHIPVVAIGGITAENVLRLKGRGMAGVAVVSGIFACEDIEKETGKLRKLADSLMI